MTALQPVARARCSIVSLRRARLACSTSCPATSLADYLSGLLIGAEIADNAAEAAITLIGNAALTRRYASACQELGRVVTSAPPDCAAHGAFAIARAAGLMKQA